MKLLVLLAGLLLVIPHGLAANRPTPLWLCVDEQGQKTARDTPCPETSRQVFTNAAPPTNTQSPTTSAPEKQRATRVTVQPQPKKQQELLSPLKNAALVLFLVFLVALFTAKRMRTKRSHRKTEPRVKHDPWSGVPESIPYPSRNDPATAAEASPPAQWSLELIRDLEWKRLEELVQGYWQARNYRADLTGKGADGGVDVKIYSPSNPGQLFAVAQCKSRRGELVGVSLVRELWGGVHHFKAELGIFYGLSGFTPDAIEFAKAKHLKLLSGNDCLGQILTLEVIKRDALLKHVTHGDFRTPTCSRCDVKMIYKEGTSKRGANYGFWGCVNYPRCNQTLEATASSAKR